MSVIPVVPSPAFNPLHTGSPPPLPQVAAPPPDPAKLLLAQVERYIGHKDSLTQKLNSAYERGADFEELCSMLPMHLLQFFGDAVRSAAGNYKQRQVKEAAARAELARREQIARQAVQIADQMVAADLLAKENYRTELPRIIDRIFEGKSPRPTPEEKAALVAAAMIFHCNEP